MADGLAVTDPCRPMALGFKTDEIRRTISRRTPRNTKSR